MRFGMFSFPKTHQRLYLVQKKDTLTAHDLGIPTDIFQEALYVWSIDEEGEIPSIILNQTDKTDTLFLHTDTLKTYIRSCPKRN